MVKLKSILVIAFLFIGWLSCNGQDSLKFKTETFDEQGNVSRTSMKTVWTHKDSIDIDFYKSNFFRPYHYPSPFINIEMKGKTTIDWAHENAEKDFNSNWTFTSRFDEEGLVIKYSYSGCMICSQLPFTYMIDYDSLNRPKSLTSDRKALERIEIEYLNGGLIKRVKEYNFGRLWKVTTYLE